MDSVPKTRNVILRQGFACSFGKLADNTIVIRDGEVFRLFPPPLGTSGAESVVMKRQRRLGTFLLVTLLGLTVLADTGLQAQVVMQGSGPSSLVRIFNTDSAVLEAQEVRKDLPCTVTPIKPTLGFDLRFHAGYEVSIPLRDLAGSEDLLTMVFRVTPARHKDDPVYFSQRLSVPAIEEGAKGNAYLQGAFDVGEGTYHVDFLMRDRSERVCSNYWDSEAELPLKDKQLVLMAPPDTIQAADREPFKEEPRVEREGESGPLNVKVIINFAPQDSHSTTLQPLDTNALASILKSIAREPRIRKFSIVAFNMRRSSSFASTPS